ncbi:MAG: ATP-binding protein [Bacteroidota bacterium]
MHFDPRTVMMMNLIGTMLMSVSLYAVSRGYLAPIKGITKWATATLLQSLGWFITGGLRGIVPDIFSIVIGNGLILLCIGLYFNIIVVFNKVQISSFWIYILVSIEAIFLFYFTSISPNVAARIATISLCTAILMFSNGYLLFSKKNDRPISHLLTGSMFVFCGLILTIRFFNSLLIDNDPDQDPFGPHPMQDISYFTFYITSVMLTFCFILMCNDRYNTQRKQAEQELIKAKKLAEELAGTKDRFLSNMSHEIRTPLNGIIGFTKVLLQSDLPPKQKQQVDVIKISSDILLVLINDILDLAKMNDGKMALNKSEFKLSHLVNDILSTFELRIAEKELKVSQSYDTNIPYILLGDSIRISQVLINLINNSTKFTNNGGQINIQINLLKQDEKIVHIELIISDTGIGIPPEKLENIFEPFIQNSHTKENIYESTGLGLSIVKRLVELMDGTIEIKSKLNEGTSVTVVFPLMKTTQIEIKTNEIPELLVDLPKFQNLNILLAEDNAINQLLAQTILHQFGFKVDTAENGRIAIQLLKENQYDIILMDLKMPEMGGIETTQYIRTQMPFPKSDIPIIAITADVTKMDIDKYQEAGINDYVIKPFNQMDLLNKILSLVKDKDKKQVLNNI